MPPIAWIVAATIVIGIVVVIALDSGGSTQQRSGDDVVLDGGMIESRLDERLRLRSGDAISEVRCPDAKFRDGDTADCTVFLDRGRELQIEVLVSGTAQDPRLDIGVPE